MSFDIPLSKLFEIYTQVRNHKSKAKFDFSFYLFFPIWSYAPLIYQKIPVDWKHGHQYPIETFFSYSPLLESGAPEFTQTRFYEDNKKAEIGNRKY